MSPGMPGNRGSSMRMPTVKPYWFWPPRTRPEVIGPTLPFQRRGSGGAAPPTPPTGHPRRSRPRTDGAGEAGARNELSSTLRGPPRLPRAASLPAPQTVCSRREADPMEEMSVSPGGPAHGKRPAGPKTSDPGDAQSAGPRDLRDWISRVEAIGQLKRITEEVSRDEEMGAITYMAHQQLSAPALLFERVKGSPRGFRSLWNPLGSSVDRFALAIGEPAGLSVMELIHRSKTKFANPIPPVVVEGEGTPVNENHQRGEKVDIREFPAARHWPRDGGE